MNSNKLISFLLLLLVLTSSCKDKDADSELLLFNNELIITLEPGKWVYYSISDSIVRGKSDIGSEEQDLEWKDRLDWDIALSEYGIRTNSGTSGRGNGGLSIISDSVYNNNSFEAIAGLRYYVDTLGVAVSRPLTE